MASPSLSPVRLGLILSLVSVLFGFGLGGLFGAFEDSLKGHLVQTAQGAPAEVYGGDEGKMKGVVDKSWAYFKRAHLHGGAIGAVALGGCLLLVLLSGVSASVQGAVATALGAGSLGYSTFWLWAGLRAPLLGSTGAAKESLAWLALPSAGVLLLGITALVGLTARALYGKGNA